MEHLLETVPLLVVPFAACLLIASLHCYMGLHVIKRGVVFVDLALAQAAALGAAVALFISPHVSEHAGHHHDAEPTPVMSEAQLAESLLSGGEHAVGDVGHESHEHDGPMWEGSSDDDEHASLAYGMSLLFALLGAVLLAFGRLRDERVPHEAIIGIVFVVCAALSVLILSKAPHGHEKMEAMLVGSILFVNWRQLGGMLVLYIVLGLLHLVLRKRFIGITADVRAAERAGVRVKLWDCLFYGSFALMVTQSVGIAGVLVVFSFLIIPAACSVLLVERFGVQLTIAWLVAVITTVAGLLLSAVGDLPTGPSLVSCFGAALVISVALRTVFKRRIQPTGVV